MRVKNEKNNVGNKCKKKQNKKTQKDYKK